jgi:thiamine biosynthesis protein ThiS
VSKDLEITVNGESRQIREGTTIAGLLEDLGFGDARVAVERNRDVIPRDRHSEVELLDGDQLEVVTFVGGG